MEEELREFGLSEKEAIILASLVRSKTPLSGNEIAKKTEITRYYAYEVLGRLQDRGFVELLPGRPKRFAFDSAFLNEIIDQEERRITKDWQGRKKRLEEITTQIQKMEPSIGRSVKEDVVIWKGSQVATRVGNIITRAKNVLILRALSTTTQTEHSELWEPILTLARNGGTARILVGSSKTTNLINSLSTAKLAKLVSVHYACPIRVTSDDLIGFDIIDSEVLIEFLSPKDPDIRLVIREPDAVRTKKSLFDSLWERGQDFRLFAFAASDDPSIDKSLQDAPPHIPLPTFQESGIHRFPSRLEAIRALQKIMIESAKKEILFANLESIPVDEELRREISQILEFLESSQRRKVRWRVLWKPHPGISKKELDAFLNVLKSIPKLELRFWEGPLDLGTLFVVDDSILLIPIFPVGNLENSILVTRNPLIKDLVVRGFNQLWKASDQNGPN